MTSGFSFPTRAKWAVVLTALTIHPVLIYLLYPLLGESGNFIAFILPVIATLMFRLWVGAVLVVVTTYSTELYISLMTGMSTEDGMPQRFAMALMTLVICFGADGLHQFIEARRSPKVKVDAEEIPKLLWAKWAAVLALTAIHPMLLHFLFPSMRESSNVLVWAAPVVATLMFGWRKGIFFIVFNVFVSSLFFRYATNQRSAEGRPKAVVSFIIISLICYGADRLRRYISQRRELAAELDRAKKMEAIGRLAGGVAHDMNNTLNAIMGSVYAHRKELEGYGREFKDLDNIVAACDRGAQLTRNLLGFARKSNYKRQTFSLNSVVEGILSILQRTACKNIHIEFHLVPHNPLIRGDRAQVENAVMNLCINALDAMGDAGNLLISTQCDDKEASVCVSDTGHGMEERIRERVFEPFFTTKEEGKGTGLGLSMVYGVVQAMNGRIRLKTVPDQGTTVTLTFPRINDDDTQTRISSLPPAAPESREILRGRTVLLIDDEPLVLRSGRRLLSTLGCTVLTAQNGKEGIEIFRKHREAVSLTIVDLIMPGMDGFATLEALLGIDETIPVLLVSGYTKESDKMESLKKRNTTVRFLAKPYRPDELIAAAKAVFDLPRTPAASEVGAANSVQQGVQKGP